MSKKSQQKDKKDTFFQPHPQSSAVVQPVSQWNGEEVIFGYDELLRDSEVKAVASISKMIIDSLEIGLKMKSYEIVHENWNALGLIPPRARAKTHQYISEVLLDDLLMMIAEVKCTELMNFGILMRMLRDITCTTAAVKRIIKCKSIVHKIMTIFTSTCAVHKINDPSGKTGHVKYISYPTIELCARVMGVCVLGSKPNEALWKEMWDTFNFSWLIDVEHDPTQSEHNWNWIGPDIIHYLVNIHNCQVRMSDVLLRQVPLRRTTGEMPSMAGDRMVRFLSEKQYVVFCSSKECNQFCDKDTVYRHCSQCMMARYCTKECQLAHWKGGHKKQCLKSSIPEDVPTVPWCRKTDDYYCSPSHAKLRGKTRSEVLKMTGGQKNIEALASL